MREIAGQGPSADKPTGAPPAMDKRACGKENQGDLFNKRLF